MRMQRRLPEYISHALRDMANRATVVLYAPSADPYLEEMARRADRVFYLQGPERPRGKGSAAKLKLAESANQTTLEAF